MKQIYPEAARQGEAGKADRRHAVKPTDTLTVAAVTWAVAGDRQAQTCSSLHSTFTISSALEDSAEAKMLKMPVSLYRLLTAVQLTIQGNWFSTRVYKRECMPLPASHKQSEPHLTRATL